MDLKSSDMTGTLKFEMEFFDNIKRDHIAEWRMMNTKLYIWLLLATLSISILLSSAEGVETEEYCDTLSLNSSIMEGNHTLPLFDPSLGNLVGVDLALDLAVLQDISLENERPNGQTIDAQYEAVLSITLPNSSPITVNASSSISEKLDAYDGETDFSGQSGRTIEGKESRGSSKMQLEPSGFVASSQNETITLPAVVEISSSTKGNIVSSMSTVAESKICITYTYEPGGSAAR